MNPGPATSGPGVLAFHGAARGPAHGIEKIGVRWEPCRPVFPLRIWKARHDTMSRIRTLLTDCTPALCVAGIFSFIVTACVGG